MRPLTFLMAAVVSVVVALLGARCDPRTQAAAVEAEPPRLEENAVEQTNDTLREFLAREPACYQWTESFGDEPIAHEGGLIFYVVGEKVFSRAWFGSAESVRRWPPVFGVGVIRGQTLFVSYRNATGEAGHEHYCASCRFDFDLSELSFKCSFMQKVNAHPEAPLTPGTAQGQRLAKTPKSFAPHLESVRWHSQNALPLEDGAEPCPVTPGAADPALAADYRGRTYHFCSQSCYEIFLQKPELFVPEGGVR